MFARVIPTWEPPGWLQFVGGIFLVVQAVVLLWWAFSVLRRKRLRHVRERRRLCPGCGYDIRKSKHRCPECGERLYR